jgi:hypothetical protein
VAATLRRYNANRCNTQMAELTRLYTFFRCLFDGFFKMILARSTGFKGIVVQIWILEIVSFG